MTEVGIDIIEIERIRSAIKRWGEKFKSKVYLPEEVKYCEARHHPAQHYAVRFAAKEAVAKALKSSHDVSMSWHDVEILTQKGGAPQVRLHGEAAQKFSNHILSLSVSHSDESAVAVALLNSQS